MNTRDSEALLGLFLDKGYSEAETVEEADIILANTCSVRGHAEQRAMSYLGSLKKLKTKPIVGLIGCMAKNKGEAIFKKMSHIDLICGPGNFDKLPKYVNRIIDSLSDTQCLRRTRIMDIEDKERREVFYKASLRFKPDRAQVVISTGCSNYCSYCIVPYVRGELRLRKPLDIVREVKRNVSLGIKKITLLGQNVNDYNYIIDPKQIRNMKLKKEETVSFVDLLKMIEKIEGIEEIDFISSQPRNISKELFTLMAESSKIRKHLHLPFQSGSNRILKLMNRGYTQQKYMKIVGDYRKIVGGSLSTDVIVGFPTESQDDFNQTKDVLKKIKFSCAYIFKYSSRNSAKGKELIDDVSDKIKIKRHKILLDLQKSISLGAR